MHCALTEALRARRPFPIIPPYLALSTLSSFFSTVGDSTEKLDRLLASIDTSTRSVLGSTNRLRYGDTTLKPSGLEGCGGKNIQTICTPRVASVISEIKREAQGR